MNFGQPTAKRYIRMLSPQNFSVRVLLQWEKLLPAWGFRAVTFPKINCPLL